MGDLAAMELEIDDSEKKELDELNRVKSYIEAQNKLQNDFSKVCELLGEKGYDVKLEEKFTNLCQK